MAKFASSGVLDATLDVVGAFTEMALCAGQPGDASQIAAATLGTTTMSGGDFTKAAGDISGRKITIGAKTGIAVTVGGTIDHVALYNPGSVGASDNFYVTTCPSRVVINGDTVNTAAADLENRAPT